MITDRAGGAILCDVLVAGGSAGGVAAALAAAECGATVCLLEETDWLGGQLTVQGVSTPDENRYIESFGCTRRYARFRAAVRDYYRTEYRLSETGRAQDWFNPGSCWVSGLSFEPKMGASILADMMRPDIDAGRIRLFHHTRVERCSFGAERPDEIALVVARYNDGLELRFQPRFILDATDTGDLLPLCGEEGVDWVVGAESQNETGEPDAPLCTRADWVQPFTFPFPVDWSPATAAHNVLQPPHDYAELRDLQNYHIKHGAITGIFTGQAPWWTYRRVLAAANFNDARIPTDVAMINTAGNDYYGGNILGSDAGGPEKQAATLARARRAALGYLYWLQTECPREDGNGVGYPEFRLRRDIFGTEDGCSVRPYIRESRRLRSLRTVLEQDIVVRDFSGNACRGENARAQFMLDTVGIGHYALDIHPNGHGEPNHFVPTRPFQIPLGALIPRRIRNLLASCKNLGTTHLSNGAYRLHPIEWNVGEAAGLMAAFCLHSDRLPRAIYEHPAAICALQSLLLREGIPLHWYIDVPLSHPAFMAVQTLAGLGRQLGNDDDLLFRPDEQITSEAWKSWRSYVIGSMPDLPERVEGSRSDAICMLHDLMSTQELAHL